MRDIITLIVGIILTVTCAALTIIGADGVFLAIGGTAVVSGIFGIIFTTIGIKQDKKKKAEPVETEEVDKAA